MHLITKTGAICTVGKSGRPLKISFRMQFTHESAALSSCAETLTYTVSAQQAQATGGLHCLEGIRPGDRLTVQRCTLPQLQRAIARFWLHFLSGSPDPVAIVVEYPSIDGGHTWAFAEGDMENGSLCVFTPEGLRHYPFESTYIRIVGYVAEVRKLLAVSGFFDCTGL